MHILSQIIVWNFVKNNKENNILDLKLSTYCKRVTSFENYMGVIDIYWCRVSGVSAGVCVMVTFLQ
jgi:hypothetical protein